MNRLQLQAAVVQVQNLRYTPAGIPVLNLGDIFERQEVREHARDRVHANFDSAYIQARDERGLLVPSDGINMPAEACMVEKDMGANCHHRENNDRNRNA